MTDSPLSRLYKQLTDGSISRRDFITRASAAGIGAGGGRIPRERQCDHRRRRLEERLRRLCRPGRHAGCQPDRRRQAPGCRDRRPDPRRGRRAPHSPVASRHDGQLPPGRRHQGFPHLVDGAGTADELPAGRLSTRSARRRRPSTSRPSRASGSRSTSTRSMPGSSSTAPRATTATSATSTGTSRCTRTIRLRRSRHRSSSPGTPVRTTGTLPRRATAGRARTTSATSTRNSTRCTRSS